MWKATQSLTGRYFIAVLSSLVALAIQSTFSPYIDFSETPFILFFGAVVLSAWWGGTRPGLVATTLSAILSSWFFLAPKHGGMIFNLDHLLRVAVFFIECVGISVLIGARKAAMDRLRVRERQEAEVADLGKLALTGENVHQIIEAAVALVSRMLEVECAVVLELTPDGKSLLLRAGLGWQAGVVGQAMVRAGADSMAGLAMLTGEAVVVGDYPSEERFEKEPLFTAHHILSGASVIIRHHEKPYGVLGVYSSAPRIFSSDDVAFLSGIANLLALAIERQQAGDLLREQRERFLVTLASIGDGVIATDIQGRISFMNPVAAALVGVREDEALGRPLHEIFRIVNEQTGEAVEAPIARVIREGAVVGLANHTCLVGRDGRRIPIDDSGAPIRNERGETIGAVLIFRDVTERRRAETEREQLHRLLDEQRHLLQEVADNAPIGMCVLNGGSLRVKWSNPTYRQYLEEPYLGMDITGLLFAEIVPNAEAGGVMDIFRRVAASGEPYTNPEFEHAGFARGVTYWRWSLIPLATDEGETIPDLMLIVMEITEQVLARKRVEELAAQAEADFGQLQAILTSMAEGLVIADLSGNILNMNPAALQIYGFQAVEESWRKAEDYAALFELRDLEGRPLPLERWPLIRAIGGETYSGYEIQVRRLDTGKYWIGNYSGTPVRNKEGAITLAIISLRDVTTQKQDEWERQRLQEELRQRAEELMRMNRSKDEFLAMLAHELRNPLAPILSSLHIMHSRGLGGDPVQARSVNMIERQAQHMARLVDDLLDVSRITRGKIELRKQTLDLARAVQSAVESSRPVIESHTHQLTLALPVEPLWVEADPARLEQVISNLINNAAKYTRAGGHIWISAERDGQQIALRVRDDGLGIPPEMLSQIFDLFSQLERSLDRSQGGLGIGLTLVKRLVELHGGTVQAFSEGLGKGSEFMVSLPALVTQPRQTNEEQTSMESQTGAHRPLRVLVVDDNTDTAMAMGEVLEIWGHEVRLAYDGNEAVEVAVAYAPEVILLDIGLPGMDGFQVARTLRGKASFASTLIVAISGYGQAEDKRRSQEVGINHHFTKPVDLTALQELVSEHEHKVGIR